MTPQIVTKPDMKLVGVEFNPDRIGWGKVPTLWFVLCRTIPHIRNIVRPDASYGYIHRKSDEGEGLDTYMAGVEVSDFAEIPEGAVTAVVPGGKYAVFTVHGGLDAIGQAYEAINKEWLPSSGYTEARCGAVEVYDERFTPDENICFEIRVAIE